MKVKVSIVNTCCILMSEAVTVSTLTVMTAMDSEEPLARDTGRQTDRQAGRQAGRQSGRQAGRHRHIDTHSLVYLNLFKILRDFENKNEEKDIFVFIFENDLHSALINLLSESYQTTSKHLYLVSPSQQLTFNPLRARKDIRRRPRHFVLPMRL